jgi:hypothetical protein
VGKAAGSEACYFLKRSQRVGHGCTASTERGGHRAYLDVAFPASIRRLVRLDRPAV